MAIVFSLPESAPSRQDIFNQLVQAARKERGMMGEEQMLEAANLLGAPDPFPIGTPFSNQGQAVHAPATRAQIERANMREAQAANEALREAGIKAYEQGVAKKQEARARIPRSIEGVTGIDMAKKAAYEAALVQRAANEADAMDVARQQRLASAPPQQDAMLSSLMRSNPRLAVALMQSQMQAREQQADRQAAGEQLASKLMAAQREAELNRGETRADREASERRFGAQLNFQGGENKLNRDQSALLAGVEQSGINARAAEENRTRLGIADKQIEAEKAGRQTPEQRREEAITTALLSSFLKDDNKMTLRQRIDAIRSLSSGNMNPNIPTLIDKVPEVLRERWDEASQGKGDARKSFTDVLRSIPLDDIRENKDAFEAWVKARYPGRDMEELLSSTTNVFNDEIPALHNRVRKIYGLPANQTTFGRTWGMGIPGLGDLIFGVPE